MKTIVFLIVLGAVVVWLFWTGASSQKPITNSDVLTGPSPAPSVVPAANVAAEATNPPLSLEPQIARPDQLVILRGTVIRAVDDVLIITCEADQAQGNVWNVNLGVGAGAGQIASLAKLEIKSRQEKIEKEFGSLQRVSNGKIRAADINPQDRMIGQFALCDYPKLTEKLHVIAVDTQGDFQGLPLYTANFKLPVESLPPPAAGVFAIYPPGVNTPEERREFLLQQIEAKKNGTAPVPRTSNRTRGY